MSTAGDLLTAAPTRLVCRRGAWILEIERLVAVERDVYQPRTQRVVGKEAIVQHLQRTVHGAPLAQAASLLISNHHSDEYSFEAVDSEWMACESKVRAESARPSVSVAANAATSELRAELELLRATLAGLRGRIATLEAQVQAVSRSLEPTSPQPMNLAPDVSRAPHLGASRGPENRRAPALKPEPARRHVPSIPPERAPSARSEPAPVDPSERIFEPSLPVLPLKLPTATAVSTCLNTLMGRKIQGRELRPVPFPGQGESPCWFSRLLDDDGNDVGAIVADLLAVVGLGGALMMVPPSELEAQRAARVPSEDVMNAMAEVANNLSATINQQPETMHVRVGPLEPMIDASLDWVKKAALSFGLEFANGMGHLLLFGR